MKPKKRSTDSQLIRNNRMKLRKVEGGDSEVVDTHRFRLVEMVDETGFYGQAAQRRAHQQEQQGVRRPDTPSPLAMLGWHQRSGGIAVHHTHRGISSLGHTCSALSVTEKRSSVKISSRSCQRELLRKVCGDKRRLERQRCVTK